MKFERIVLIHVKLKISSEKALIKMADQPRDHVDSVRDDSDLITIRLNGHSLTVSRNVPNTFQDAFLKIDVEWCVEKMIKKVEEDTARTPRHVARRLFEEDEEGATRKVVSRTRQRCRAAAEEFGQSKKMKSGFHQNKTSKSICLFLRLLRFK